MNKYTVESKWNPNCQWQNVRLNHGQKQIKMNLPNDFARHIKYGDVLREYRTYYDEPLAYYANGHMHFIIEPCLPFNDTYASTYICNAWEKMALNIALIRTLRANKIKPSICFNDNLRKYTKQIMGKVR